jgi:polysaccharide biosynthesis/export protein
MTYRMHLQPFNHGRPFMPSLLRSTLSIAFAFATALASAQTKPATNGGNGDYRLGAGDAIRVQVYQNPDLMVEARVSESGSISYPLIGNVAIGGLSIGQAENRIAQALRSSNILKSPQVNIVLLQVRGNQVSVLGQVNKPGRFPLETFNVRVSDMLAAAGGVTPTGDDVLVVSGVRDGRPFRKTIDIPALFAGARSQDDIMLAAGDTLYVNKAPMYYIYGEAQKPGPYRIERGMTVMQALAQGGGTTNRGSQDRLRLHRTSSDGSVVQTVPRLTDPVQPGDVLFVRESIF